MASDLLYHGKTWRHFLAISLVNVCCDFNSSQLRRCEFGIHRLFFGYDTMCNYACLQDTTWKVKPTWSNVSFRRPCLVWTKTTCRPSNISYLSWRICTCSFRNLTSAILIRPPSFSFWSFKAWCTDAELISPSIDKNNHTKNDNFYDKLQHFDIVCNPLHHTRTLSWLYQTTCYFFRILSNKLFGQTAL